MGAAESGFEKNNRSHPQSLGEGEIDWDLPEIPCLDLGARLLWGAVGSGFEDERFP